MRLFIAGIAAAVVVMAVEIAGSVVTRRKWGSRRIVDAGALIVDEGSVARGKCSMARGSGTVRPRWSGLGLLA